MVGGNPISEGCQGKPLEKKNKKNLANLLGNALGTSNHPLGAVQLRNLHFPGSGQEGLEQEVPAAPQVQVRMTPVSQSSQPPAQGGSVLLGTDQMSPSPAPPEQTQL